MWKIFLVFGTIKAKYNIGLSVHVRIKTGNSITLLDLMIVKKLLRILTIDILINYDFK